MQAKIKQFNASTLYTYDDGEEKEEDSDDNDEQEEEEDEDDSDDDDADRGHTDHIGQCNSTTIYDLNCSNY